MFSFITGLLATLGLWAANGYSTACLIVFLDEEETPNCLIK
jgi:hypothetical protein